MNDPGSKESMRLPDDIDENKCTEMFRRSLLQGDSESRKWLQQHLSKMMYEWLSLHPLKVEACRLKSPERYVIEAFECFWHASNGDNALELSGLPVMLRYLQVSLNSVVLEMLRNSVQPKEKRSSVGAGEKAKGAFLESALAYPYVKYPIAMESGEAENGSRLWERLLQLLADGREQRLAYLLFHCGLKPGEIVRCCPQEFSDIEEVYRLKRAILERFLHNDGLLYAANKP